MFVIKDVLFLVKKIFRYFYWNIKGVRVSFLSEVSIKAKIDRNCFFSGISQISGFSIIEEFTYGHNVNIHRAKIGSYCSIGPDVKIGLDEHPLDRESTHPKFYNDFLHKEVVIGNHVWLGANSIILSGVTIGEHVIVAAGAVVTKNVEPFSVVAGVPAKTIKKRK